jgi:hypothetical protein
MSAVFMNRRHGHRGAGAGRQRRRRQLRWSSHQRCAVGSKRTRRRSSRLAWQRLRRKLMVHIHKTTAALRSVQHAVVQPARVACSQSSRPQEDGRGVARATHSRRLQPVSAHKHRHTHYMAVTPTATASRHHQRRVDARRPLAQMGQQRFRRRRHPFLSALATASHRLRARAAAPESVHTAHTCS